MGSKDQAADKFTATFGERFSAAIEAAGFSRGKMAHALSTPDAIVREGDVRRWASGKHAPNMARVGIIADALGVTVDYLLGRSDDPHGVAVPVGEQGDSPVKIAGDALKELASRLEGRPQGAAASRTSRTSRRPATPAAARRRKSA